MERVALFVDAHNMKGSASRQSLEVDYARVIRDAGAGGPRRGDGGRVRGLDFRRAIVQARVYMDPATPGDGSEHRERFVSMARSVGYEVVECCEEGDGRKSAADRDIIIDMLLAGLNGHVDTVVLLSGDGGFTRPVWILRSHGIRVWVYAFEDASQTLQEAADVFVDLADPRAPGGPFTRARPAIEDEEMGWTG